MASKASYTDHQLESARRAKAGALAWIAANGPCWKYIEQRFCEMGRRGRRFTMALIVEDAREKGELSFTDARGTRFGISNTYRGVFVRLLRRAHPEYDHLTRVRPSALDQVMGEG